MAGRPVARFAVLAIGFVLIGCTRSVEDLREGTQSVIEQKLAINGSTVTDASIKVIAGKDVVIDFSLVNSGEKLGESATVELIQPMSNGMTANLNGASFRLQIKKEKISGHAAIKVPSDARGACLLVVKGVGRTLVEKEIVVVPGDE